MKIKLLAGLMISAMAGAPIFNAFGQGTIYFTTRFYGIDAPVTIGDENGPGPGPSFSAQLYVVRPDGAVEPLAGSLTTFRAVPPEASPLLARYIVAVDVVVPGVPIREDANVLFRAWPTSFGSYEATPPQFRGESPQATVTLGGGEYPPSSILALQGFVIPIPEPSTLALLVAGGVVLFWGRGIRRKERPQR